MKHTLLLPFLLTISFYACSDKPGIGPNADLNDASLNSDVNADVDAPTDAGDCVPNCHWDCFGGVSCSQGKVWKVGYGAVPCCNYDDPWPFDGPECSAGELFSCPGEECQTSPTDTRYEGCFEYSFTENNDLNLLSHFFPAFCEEGFKNTGTTCENDDDCRPSADANKLRCNFNTNLCEIMDRPNPTVGYGGNCGLSEDTIVNKEIIKGETCEWCHVYESTDPACLKQACTMTCKFDEDCPEGSVCLCLGSLDSQQPFQFCVQTVERTEEARREWLNCP